MILPKTSEVLLDSIVYPESDGQPMAENTVQFRWIVTIQGGLDTWFEDDPNVFVAGDLLWYPVEGSPKIRQAPDTMVVIGRPKGDRGSYKQWEENGIPPQVVFEVLSPGNRDKEMQKKRLFYQKYGVQEYYEYDPNRNTLEGWIRSGNKLARIPDMQDWVSPALKIRFVLNNESLVLYLPDGRCFATYREMNRDRKNAINMENEAKENARLEKQRATNEKLRADDATKQATDATKQATDAMQRAEEATKRAERLSEQLRALGIDPDA